MKLEVNMYVRTKKGIYKINHFINNIYTQKFTYIDNQGVSNILDEEEIIKASHNIIDLIEVGDYVNGSEVTSKDQFLGFGNHDWYILDNEIKSIVTKQQFERMSYKVGE